MNVSSLKVACIIPARLNSVRLPRKVLLNLAGKPILQRIWETAKPLSLFHSVLFAVDAQETADLVEGFGGDYCMTSVHCQNGTERIIEVFNRGDLKADVWVSWQADCPLVTPRMIEQLLQSCGKDDADVWTLKKPLRDQEELFSPNIVKVVTDSYHNGLYFSRSPIPYVQGKGTHVDHAQYFKHIGLYAYSSRALSQIAHMKATDLEVLESLEQLRWLQNGLRIKVHETEHDDYGINVPQDLEVAEKILQK